jgi:hypothetical protein
MTIDRLGSAPGAFLPFGQVSAWSKDDLVLDIAIFLTRPLVFHAEIMSSVQTLGQQVGEVGVTNWRPSVVTSGSM